MGKISSAVKNRWNAKTYDDIKIRVPKGEKAEMQAYAASIGKSLNSFIVDAVREKMKKAKS